MGLGIDPSYGCFRQHFVPEDCFASLAIFDPHGHCEEPQATRQSPDFFLLGGGNQGILQSLSEQPFLELLAGYSEMDRHLRKNGGDCPNPQRTVTGNRNVVLMILSCREPHMAASLAGNLVAQGFQRPAEVFGREVTRELAHTAITSSRTKCSLITFGACPSSK